MDQLGQILAAVWNRRSTRIVEVPRIGTTAFRDRAEAIKLWLVANSASILENTRIRVRLPQAVCSQEDPEGWRLQEVEVKKRQNIARSTGRTLQTALGNDRTADSESR